MNIFLLLKDPLYNEGYEIGHKIGHFIEENRYYILALVLIVFLSVKYIKSKKRK